MHPADLPAPAPRGPPPLPRHGARRTAGAGALRRRPLRGGRALPARPHPLRDPRGRRRPLPRRLPDYRWTALHDTAALLRHSHYLNIQARSILACLHGLPGREGKEKS
ncbi:NDP-hexose 2,3-dehydratase family protein [Streptomyces sp. H-KF8]|uniref:NDP-hexose 2,3-dehydratase family protein n=1 Tax=Streptomyces sp. H-KF8 TaxID=1727216 RepID=UPI002D21C06B|nr:NDP-hexose 2,3-dehydratase family protein [Streptomyces sp. H-KF8]